MSRTLEQIMYDERVGGREEGRAELISKMLANGMPSDQIAKLCGLPLEHVESLSKTTQED